MFCCLLLLPWVGGAVFRSPTHEFGQTALSCTDDSDCIALGHKYGCFLYRSGNKASSASFFVANI